VSFSRISSEALRKKIEVLTSDRNKALIETFRENSRRQTLLVQMRDKLTGVRADIATAEHNLNASIAAINADSTAQEAIPLVDLSAQTEAVARRLLSVQEQTAQFGRDNDEIIGAFREQGLGQDITGLLEKVHEYQRQTELAETHLREIARRGDTVPDRTGTTRQVAAEFMDGLLSRQGVIDTAFASLTKKPHLTQDQQALIKDILTDIRIYGQPHFDVTAFYNGCSVV
jgi:hypothetical protein